MQEKPSQTYLLFRQIAVLAFVAGCLAFFLPLQAFVFFYLLVLYNAGRKPFGTFTLILALAFGLGLFYTQFRVKTEPPLPEFVATSETHKDKNNFLVQGTVKEVQNLPNNRLSAVLKDILISPANSDTTEKTNSGISEKANTNSGQALQTYAYEGQIRWSWYNPKKFMRSGDLVQGTMQLLPMQGLANPDTLDIEEHWERQGVFLRGLSRKKDSIDVLHTQGSKLYQFIYQNFLLSLPNEHDVSVRDALEQGGYAQHPLLKAAHQNIPNQLANTNSHGEKSSIATKQTKPIRLSDGASFLPALLFGDRSFIKPEHQKLIAKSTLAHSLALSGLHLGYAVLVGLGFAKLIGYCKPSLWLNINRQSFAFMASVPFALLYLWLGQAPISLLRASFMLFFWILLLFLHKPKQVLDGLIWAVWLLILLDPSSIMDLRLQLSAVSVASIALCLPYINKIVGYIFKEKENTDIFTRPNKKTRFQTRKFWKNLGSFACKILFISFTTSFFIAPFLISAFGTFGLWFPLNLLWLPTLAVVVMPLTFLGGLASTLGLANIAHFLLVAASLPCTWLINLLSLMDGQNILLAPVVYRPHWLFWVGFWLICLYLPLWLKNKITAKPHPSSEQVRALRFTGLGMVLCLASVLWFIFLGTPKGVTLRVLDVGQGQSVLVEWNLPEGKGRALVDGGSLSYSGFSMGQGVVAPTLTAQRLPQVDALIYSHPDIDHFGGLLYILENFSIKFYGGNPDSTKGEVAEQEQSILKKHNLRKVALVKGDRVPLATDLYFEVLWPPANYLSAHSKNSNDASLFLYLVWQGTKLAILCGDLGTTPLKHILQDQNSQAEKLQAQVLILPHHGSHKSFSPEFYKAVDPKIALVSTGFANQWGFPHKDVVETLKNHGIPLYNTAIHGQIQILWQNHNALPEVQTTR